MNGLQNLKTISDRKFDQSFVNSKQEQKQEFQCYIATNNITEQHYNNQD